MNWFLEPCDGIPCSALPQLGMPDFVDYPKEALSPLRSGIGKR